MSKASAFQSRVDVSIFRGNETGLALLSPGVIVRSIRRTRLSDIRAVTLIASCLSDLNPFSLQLSGYELPPVLLPLPMITLF